MVGCIFGEERIQILLRSDGYVKGSNPYKEVMHDLLLRLVLAIMSFQFKAHKSGVGDFTHMRNSLRPSRVENSLQSETNKNGNS